MTSSPSFLSRAMRAGLACFGAVSLAAHAVEIPPSYNWSNFAGAPGGAGNADGTGTQARFQPGMGGAVLDKSNNLYVVDQLNSTIRKITSAGVVTTIAGLAGQQGSTDDTGSAARFRSPTGIALDKNGNLVVADTGNHTIRRVTPAGVVTTIAGTPGVSGSDNGTGTSATFNQPNGVAVDVFGNIYIADTGNHVIRKITAAGIVSTFAGVAGSSGSTDGSATTARFNQPMGLAADQSSNLFVADTGNHTVRRVSSNGIVFTLAGKAGFTGTTDAAGPSARFSTPIGIASDASGVVYVADWITSRIRQVQDDGSVTTVTGKAGQGYLDGSSLNAKFHHPTGLAVNSGGSTMFVVDSINSAIRKAAIFGAVTTLAGGPAFNGYVNATGSAARFEGPTGLTLDSAGSVVVADLGNHSIRKVTSAGVVTLFAGGGSPTGFGTTGGTGSAARFNSPHAVAMDSTGVFYVADSGNHAIRKITGSAIVTTFAGSVGNSGSTDDTGTAAKFYNPSGIAVDSSNNLFVTDTNNHTIRRITPAGVVTTFAGSAGLAGSTDDTGTAARFDSPSGIAADSANNLYVADKGNHVVRKITPAGVVTTLAGSAGLAGSVDGTGAVARFNTPMSVSVDRAGNVYMADANGTVRRITPAGVTTTIGGVAGVIGGRDGIGTAALFASPQGVLVTPTGQLYLADTDNNRIAVAKVADISIEQPTGTALNDGVSSIDFGSVAALSSKQLVFTIKNTSTQSLSIGDITIDGADAAAFAVTPTSIATALAANATTTLTVTFTPTTVGALSAALHVGSNDPDESPFDIALSGTGVPGVSFANALNFVNEEVNTANISIVRTGSTIGTASVVVNSAPGSATLADYAIVSNVTINFADGQASATVPVTINPDALSEPNEDFTLTLSSPTNASLGTPSTTTVRIVDPADTVKPTVTISAPASNANFAEGAVITVSGNAADNRGVQKVQVAINAGAFADATTKLSTNGQTATYSAVVTPVPGSNTVFVKSIDTRNNESTVTSRSFFYNVMRPLTVNVDPVGGGTLTAPFPGSDATKKVGFSYTLTAKPATGKVFNGWTNDTATANTGITTASAELPTLTFTHRDGLVLTAHFITNPFTPAIIGSFNGLVTPDTVNPAPAGTASSNETTGFFTAKVLSTGAFTGTLKIDGLSLALSGVFDNTGVARFGTTRATTVLVTRPTKPSLEVALQLDMIGATNKITGTVTQRYRSTITAVSKIDADRAYYSSANKVSSTLAGTSSRAYTLVLKHRATQSGLVAADYPQGEGYATGTLKTDGTVTFSGKLADNTAISVSMPLSKTNQWPLYQQLYSTGSIAGMVTVDAGATDTDMSATGVVWFRPYQSVQWYPWGWSDGIFVDVIGAIYNPSPSSVFPVALPVDATNGNVKLTFTDGLLASSITKNANISSTNVASKAPTSDASWAFSLTASSGLISGSFTHSDATKPSYQGVLFQKGANKAGYGYFMTVAPRVVDGTGQSGGVKLEPK